MVLIPAVTDTLAGGGGGIGTGRVDSLGTFARFNNPNGVSYNGINNALYVADSNNNQVRSVNLANGAVSTLAGYYCGLSTGCGSSNGVGTFAGFYNPVGVVFDATRSAVYVSDGNNNLIRSVSLPSTAVTTLAGSTSPGSTNGVGTYARFNGPQGLALGSFNDLYIADSSTNVIRSMSLSSYVISTFAGKTGISRSVDGVGTFASFKAPSFLAYDGSRNALYVSDSAAHGVRLVWLLSGLVTTLAGSFDGSTTGSTDAVGTNAFFNRPFGLAYDAAHDLLYVADSNNFRIRSVSCGSGLVSTVAGNSIDSTNGVGTNAQLNSPLGVAFNDNGVLFVTESSNNLVRTVKVSIPLTVAPSYAPTFAPSVSFSPTVAPVSFYSVPNIFVWVGDICFEVHELCCPFSIDIVWYLLPLLLRWCCCEHL